MVNSPQPSSRSFFLFGIVPGHPAFRSFAVSTDLSQIWQINSTIPPKPLQYLKGFPSQTAVTKTFILHIENLIICAILEEKSMENFKPQKLAFYVFYFLVTFFAYHWNGKYVFFLDHGIVPSRTSELPAVPHIVFLILFTKMCTIEFFGDIYKNWLEKNVP